MVTAPRSRRPRPPPGSTIDQGSRGTSASGPLVPSGVRERAGTDETLQPAAAGMHLAPVLSGEVDHGKAGRRQPLIEPLARLDIA